MIGIYLRPDGSQVVIGEVKKKKGLEVFDSEVMEPVLSYVISGETEQLTDFFLRICKLFRIKRKEVYLVLPDELVLMDCQERDIVDPDKWEDTIIPWAAQLLKVSDDDYVITTPFVIKKKDKLNITFAAIKKNFVNTLVQAASAADIKLVAIGSSSFALLRYLQNWDSEHCFIEIWEQSLAITGYNPVKGMFTLGWPSVGYQELLYGPGDNDEILQYINRHDYMAFKTFDGLANTDIPIYLVSPKDIEITSLLSTFDVGKRLQSVVPPENVFSKSLTKDKINEFAVPIGMLLRSIFDQRKTTEETFYPVENYIPIDVQLEKSFQMACKTVKKILGAVAVIIIFMMAMLGSMTYYIQSSREQDIPETLIKEYEMTVAKDNLLLKKQALFAQAENEDVKAASVIRDIISVMPNDVKLTRIVLMDSKQNNVLIEGVSSDVESLQKFVGYINDSNGMVWKAVVDRIISGTNDFNSFKNSVIIKAEIKP